MAADGSVTAEIKFNISEAQKNLNKLNEDIKKTEEQINKYSQKKNFAQQLKSDIEQAKMELSELKTLLDPESGARKLSFEEFIEAQENAKRLEESIKEMEKEWKKAASSTEKYDEKLAEAEAKLEQQKEAYGEIQRKIVETSGEAENLSEKLSGNGDGAVGEKIKNSIESAREAINSIIEKINESIASIKESFANSRIGEALREQIEKAQPALDRLRDAFKNSKFGQALEEYVENLSGAVNKVVDRLKEKLDESGFAEGFKSGLRGILEYMEDIYHRLPEIKQSLADALSGMADVIEKGGFQELGKQAASGLTSAIASISPEAALAVAAVKLLKAAFDKLWEAAVKDSQFLVNGIVGGFKALVSAIKEAPGAIKRFAKASNSNLKKIAKLFATITKNIAETLKNINLFSKISDKLTKALNKLGSMIRRVFVYSVLTSFFRALRTHVSEYLSLNAEFMTALGRLKSALATAFQPILNVVIPALTALVNMLTKVISIIAQFIAALFGTTAKTAQANAKALNDQAKATEAAGNAAEKASQQFGSFDEIDTLSFDDDSASGAAGAIGELGDALYDLDLDDTWFKSWGEAFDAFLDKILNEGIPALKDALNGFADWMNWFSGNLLEMFTFPGIKDKLKTLGEEIAKALNDMINRINWDQLGRALGAGLDDAIAFLLGILDTLDFMNLGKRLAEIINGLLGMVDWYEFGRLLWSGFKTALETLAGLLENLNMPRLAQAASDVIIGFFDAMKETINKIHWDVIGQQIATFLNNIKWYDVITAVWDAISTAINSVFVMARNFIDTLRWGDIAVEIYSAINASIGKLQWRNIGQTIGNAFKEVFEFATTIISGIRWHDIGVNIARFIMAFDFVGTLGNLADMIAAGINAAMELACGMLDVIMYNAFEIASGIAERLRNAIASVEWSHLGQVVGNGIKTALGFVAGLLDPSLFYEVGKSIGDFLINLDWPGILEGLGRAIANGIKSAVALIRGFLDSVQPNLQQLATDIADKINNFVKSVNWAELGRTINDGINTALNFLLNILDQLDWDSIGQAVVDFFINLDWPRLLAKWQKVIGTAIGGALRGIDLGDALDLGMNLVGGILKGAIDKFNAEGGILGWIKRIIFEPFINAFKSLFGIASPSTVMAEQGGYIVEGLILGITNAWEGITAFFTEAVAALLKFLSEGWNNIKEATSEAWYSIKESIATSWETIKETISAALETLKETISNAFESIKAATSQAWGNIHATLYEKWENIKETISTAIETLKTRISEAWETIKQKTSETWENIKSLISEKWENIKATVSAKAEEIRSKISEVWANIQQSTSDKWSQIKETLLNAWNELKNNAVTKFQEIKQSIIDKVSELRNHDWASIGKSIVDGIVNGLQSIWNTLKDWAGKVKDTISNAISGAKTAASNALKSVTSTYSISANTPIASVPVAALSNVTIPRLASGAVIPPNREFMALLGDNKYGNNLEGPESLFRQIVREESGGGNEQIVSLLEALLTAVKAGKTMVADGKAIAKVVTNEQNRMTRRSGASVLLG